MPAKLLIVDDEPNLLRLIEYALSYAGYEVVLAETGNEAIERVASEQPDLVILDVMLPDIDGFEVCRRLRSDPKTAELPVIMLSARTQVDDMMTGLEAGADEYVPKPVDAEEMVTRVNSLLGRSGYRSQDAASEPDQTGRLVACVGAKGGVGTTTIAVNLGAVLSGGRHQSERDVVVAELRGDYGSLSQYVKHADRRVTDTLGTLLELPAEDVDRRALRTRLYRTGKGFEALFGPQTLEHYHLLDSAHATAIVGGLTRLAEITLLDVPDHLPDALESVLHDCDPLIVVIEPVPACIEAAKKLLERLGVWGVLPQAVRAVVVHRAELGVSLTQRDIADALNCEVLGTVPTAAQACYRAQELGVPLVQYQPDSAAATALVEIAHRVLGEAPEASSRGRVAGSMRGR